MYLPVDAKPDVTIDVIRHEYLYDPGFDIGTFGGYAVSGTVPRFQVGLRYSPVRLSWGILAPDVVASQTAAGVGLSVYPPSTYFGRWWDHFGLGGWYVAPYDGSHGAVVVGLAFSSHR